MNPAEADALLAVTEDHLWDGACGDMAWDVGANTGQNLERMLGLFTRVIAVEPAAESFAGLEATRSGDGRVLLLQLAVSDHEGTLFLDVRSAPILSGQLTAAGMPYHGEHSDQPGMANWGPVTGYREIGCVTLDGLAARYGEPDFIKIDTEGHEVQCLKGATGLLAGRRPGLVIEYHTAALRAECLAILAAAGYETEVVRPPHFPEGHHMHENYGWLKCLAS